MSHSNPKPNVGDRWRIQRSNGKFSTYTVVSISDGFTNNMGKRVYCRADTGSGRSFWAALWELEPHRFQLLEKTTTVDDTRSLARDGRKYIQGKDVFWGKVERLG